MQSVPTGQVNTRPLPPPSAAHMRTYATGVGFYSSLPYQISMYGPVQYAGISAYPFRT